MPPTGAQGPTGRGDGHGSTPVAVLFDAGATLLQLDADRLAPRVAARSLRPTRPLLEGFWHAIALLDSEFVPGREPFAAWFPRWVARIAEHVGVAAEPFREAYLEADGEMMLWSAPIPGAADTLDALRRAGVRVAVVSNADGRVADVLDHAGLADRLELIVDSGVVGVEKPDPAIFAHALEPLDVPAERAWYVGDSVAYDVPAAAGAGLTPWVIDHTGMRAHQHSRVVTDFAALVDAALGRA